MKRCPQCLFIYPDADARCDFDNTPLVVVDESELEAATETPKKTKKKRATKKRQRKTTAITAVVGLLLGISSFLVYYRLTHRTQHTAQIRPIPIVSAQPLAAPVTPPSAVTTASPSPTPAPIPKPTTERIATAHTSTTVTPVSTSGPGMGKKLGGKPTIVLTSGGKIDADEVWRTRDGVWYRRNGIVTLLKKGRVRAIVNQ